MVLGLVLHVRIMFMARKTDFSRPELWAAEGFLRLTCPGILALTRYTD